ncbi:MAG: hypothetical protein WCR52_21695 [Bacteroidota bacterium]
MIFACLPLPPRVVFASSRPPLLPGFEREEMETVARPSEAKNFIYKQSSIMKRILLFLFLGLGYTSYLPAQTNPVSKSLGIYLKEFEKQSKIDTLFVLYDSPSLQKYHPSNINAVKIIEVNTYQPNRVVVTVDLEDLGAQKIIVLTPQISKPNGQSNELDIFTNGSMYFKFRVKNGKWKYKSKTVVAI